MQLLARENGTEVNPLTRSSSMKSPRGVFGFAHTSRTVQESCGHIVIKVFCRNFTNISAATEKVVNNRMNFSDFETGVPT